MPDTHVVTNQVPPLENYNPASSPVLTEALIREGGHQPGGPLAGKPYWVLEAREVATVEVPQEMLNHWGVFVTSQAAVDAAFEKVNAHHKDFGIGRVQKPRFRHGSYAFYFVDGDSNWWEIEYRTPELLYTTLRDKGDQH